MGFKIVHFNIKTQNLELVNLKCVTYAQPTPLSLRETTHAETIDIEYNKRLDHRRPCLEDDLTAGSNL